MKKLLVPYITAGYPEKAWFQPLTQVMDASGADVIEIGVPFSDPIADGPVIQAASHRSLQNGTTLRWILGEVKEMRAALKAELILFSYFNPIASLGSLQEAAALIKDAGFTGVLVPDLALEEAVPLIEALHAVDLHYIPLIAPNTSDTRLKQIAAYTTHFAYGVSVTGVTGVRQGVSSGLEAYLDRVRRFLNKTFVVGFGVSTREDAHEIAKVADGVVVGSAIVKRLGEASDLEQAKQDLTAFMQGLREGIDSAG